MLTKWQNAMFRPLVERAWRAYCGGKATEAGAPDPEDRGARDKWYRNELIQGFGIWTSKEIDGAVLFGKVCLHFAQIAGDEGMIMRLAADDERRAMWRLKQTMAKAGINWDYLKGIARRMHFGVDDWGPDVEAELREMPAELVLKLNTAVYLLYRRKEKAKVPA